MKRLNKKTLLVLSLLLNFTLTGIISYFLFTERSKNEYFKYFNFSKQFTLDTTLCNVCFVGNSITANWMNIDSDFFYENNFLNKGVGGQSSTQILLRFQQDVVSLKPSIVVLNTGINDIGKADGFYSAQFTLQNIKSMIDICNSNNIQLVLTSVLPATKIKTSRFTSITNLYSDISQLNLKIKDLAEKNNLLYVDYFANLVDGDGNFNKKLTFDGVHPNKKGYDIMKQLIMDKLGNINVEK